MCDSVITSQEAPKPIRVAAIIPVSNGHGAAGAECPHLAPPRCAAVEWNFGFDDRQPDPGPIRSEGACRIGRGSGRLTPTCRNECHNGKDGNPSSSDGEFPGRHARINRNRAASPRCVRRAAATCCGPSPSPSSGSLVVIVVALAALLPSTLVATKRDCVERNEAGECTKQGPSENVQFAIVPADAQAVEPTAVDRRPDDVRQRRAGAVRHCSQAPSSACWSGGSVETTRRSTRRATPICSANETPQQQTSRGQRDMRTAKETAEYVALSRLGFDARADCRVT